MHPWRELTACRGQGEGPTSIITRDQFAIYYSFRRRQLCVIVRLLVKSDIELQQILW